MKNKKIVFIIFLIIFCVTLKMSLFSVNETREYKLNNLKNGISVMVYDELTGEYVKGTSIPIGNYYLNDELSVCSGNATIEEYNNLTGEVVTKMKNGGECTFYFDTKLLVYKTKTFSYDGTEKTFIVPETGNVKIEAWGAQGASYSDSIHGGYGGYSVGEIYLSKGTTLYINVGGAGSKSTSTSNLEIAGGYNGGGAGHTMTSTTGTRTSGGGATSVAFSSGTLYALGQNSKQSDVIIVAGGGGGAGYYDSSQYGSGGNGGGIQGNEGTASTSSSGTIGYGGTQLAGGTGINNGSYGIGGNAVLTQDSNNYGGNGGGGGYYGGGSSFNNAGGGGGSGYIGYSTLKEKHMTCYNCTTSTVESTYTESNTCVNETATSDCSKIGSGYVKLTYLDELDPSTLNKTFTYKNSQDTYIVEVSGIYKLETWGAQGGSFDSYPGGYGAYAVGEIYLSKGTTLYINVGGEGTYSTSQTDIAIAGGYNGGGDGRAMTAAAGKKTSGGGATSIALSSGTLYQLGQNNKQNDVIIVAGGGGGSGYYSTSDYGISGNAGGITGSAGSHSSGSIPSNDIAGGGGTQSSGGTGINPGVFGKGGNAQQTYDSNNYGGSGGGGGWYGGGASFNNTGSGGGSSYIGYSTLTNKKMVCYTGCTTSAASNINTYTIANSCAETSPTADCSKKGEGYAKISFANYNNSDLKFHLDSKTFNGTSDTVNTGVYLFNSENLSKDFLVSFNIDSATYETGQKTLFNAFDESKANGYYYGVVFRFHSSESAYYQAATYLNDSNTSSQNVAISGTTNVRIKRENKLISYSINNGSWTSLSNFSSSSATFNVPCTFGSSIDASGSPYRFFKGTLSDMNIYVYD